MALVIRLAFEVQGADVDASYGLTPARMDSCAVGAHAKPDAFILRNAELRLKAD